MLFGAILGPEKNKIPGLLKTKILMDWEDGLEIPVNFHDFHGGFFLSNSLPYKPKDFFLIDKKKGLLILLSGDIFNREEIQKKTPFDPSFS
ncbi:MAG: hypothetical protein V2I46_11140, partial [Bacteroides sp.]|nr:hypothetical protein [Bacteroides sp.]